MHTRQRIILYSLTAAVAGAGMLWSFQGQTGEWALGRSENADRVLFSLQGGAGEHHHFNTSSDWSKTDFHGIDWSAAGKHDVHFTVDRDAGKLTCEGFLKDGEGAGLFQFGPNPRYRAEMTSLGFSGITSEQQLAFAVHDVSLKFARDMKAAGVDGLDAGKLMAFRIFRVNDAFIHQLRSAGLKAANADKLIAFRIHGVTPDFVQSLRSLGYTPDEDKLIAFRIHGVSAEFIQQLQRLGYRHPEADQLIAMRIHGVTPEYIQNLRTHGMKELTVNQLVSLRIHGIN